jgi:hypothetical protein
VFPEYFAYLQDELMLELMVMDADNKIATIHQHFDRILNHFTCTLKLLAACAQQSLPQLTVIAMYAYTHEQRRLCPPRCHFLPSRFLYPVTHPRLRNPPLHRFPLEALSSLAPFPALRWPVGRPAPHPVGTDGKPAVTRTPRLRPSPSPTLSTRTTRLLSFSIRRSSSIISKAQRPRRPQCRCSGQIAHLAWTHTP